MMDNIMKAVLEGMAQPAPAGQSRQRQPAGDPLIDLLGGILGGASAPQPQRRQARSRQQDDPMGMIGDLMGDLMGAGSVSSSGGGSLFDLLGMVMGAGNPSQQAANPIVKMLSEKLGLPPAIVQMIVSYFTAKMLSGKMGGMGTGSQSGGRYQQGRGQSGALDLDHLLESMGDEQEFQSQLRASGMPQELAQHAGIDQDLAMQSIQEILGMMAGQRETPRPVSANQGNLKGLLDSWEVE